MNESNPLLFGSALAITALLVVLQRAALWLLGRGPGVTRRRGTAERPAGFAADGS